MTLTDPMDLPDPSYSVYIPIQDAQDIFVTFPTRMLSYEQWQQFVDVMNAMAPALVEGYGRPEIVLPKYFPPKPRPAPRVLTCICGCIDLFHSHNRDEKLGGCGNCRKCTKFTEDVGVPE